MGKCRYNLSEDCHNKDCLICTFDKIRAEIEDVGNQLHYLDTKEVLQIIDKYKNRK